MKFLPSRSKDTRAIRSTNPLQNIQVQDKRTDTRVWVCGSALLCLLTGISYWKIGWTFPTIGAITALVVLNAFVLLRQLLVTGEWAVMAGGGRFFIRFISDPVLVKWSDDALTSPRVVEFDLAEVRDIHATRVVIKWPRQIRQHASRPEERLLVSLRPEVREAFVRNIWEVIKQRPKELFADHWLVDFAPSGDFSIKWERTFSITIEAFIDALRSYAPDTTCVRELQCRVLDVGDILSKDEDAQRVMFGDLLAEGQRATCLVILTQLKRLSLDAATNYLQSIMDSRTEPLKPIG